MKKTKMRQSELAPQYVVSFPAKLADGVIYVSMEFATSAHNCCCGCGEKVVTPFSPTDWKLIFDGDTVSLYPSIGNWGFDCQSHYWIRRNRVEWAPKWSKKEIAAGRNRDRHAKGVYFDEREFDLGRSTARDLKDRRGIWARVKAWF
jgi:hypothetical protein